MIILYSSTMQIAPDKRRPDKGRAEQHRAEQRGLAEDLGSVLARLYGFLRRSILPEQMSLTQALALGTLRDLGPQRVTDLAGIEGVRQPTCTALVNAMEAQGWVVRTVDESDRRAVVVELTSDGLAVLEAMTETRAAVLERYLQVLSEGEREGLAAAIPSLKKLIELGAEGEGLETWMRATTAGHARPVRTQD